MSHEALQGRLTGRTVSRFAARDSYHPAKEIVMTALAYPYRTRSFARSSVLVLLAAGAGYCAGAFVNNTCTPSGGTAAFAQSARAMESERAGPLPSAFGPGTFAAEEIDAPRECDATRGIVTSCVFM